MTYRVTTRKNLYFDSEPDNQQTTIISTRGDLDEDPSGTKRAEAPDARRRTERAIRNDTQHPARSCTTS
jgi:hypothetical protein